MTIIGEYFTISELEINKFLDVKERLEILSKNEENKAKLEKTECDKSFIK